MTVDIDELKLLYEVDVDWLELKQLYDELAYWVQRGPVANVEVTMREVARFWIDALFLDGLELKRLYDELTEDIIRDERGLFADPYAMMDIVAERWAEILFDVEFERGCTWDAPPRCVPYGE